MIEASFCVSFHASFCVLCFVGSESMPIFVSYKSSQSKSIYEGPHGSDCACPLCLRFTSLLLIQWHQANTTCMHAQKLGAAAITNKSHHSHSLALIVSLLLKNGQYTPFALPLNIVWCSRINFLAHVKTWGLSLILGTVTTVEYIHIYIWVLCKVQ